MQSALPYFDTDTEDAVLPASRVKAMAFAPMGPQLPFATPARGRARLSEPRGAPLQKEETLSFHRAASTAAQAAASKGSLQKAGVRASRVSSATVAIEAQLYTLLQQVPPAARRGLLTRHFSEPQRLLLEKWILQNRPQLAAPCPQVCSQRVPTGQAALGSSGTTAGISRLTRGGRTTFRASVYAGPFRLFTGFSLDCEMVQRYWEVMVRIRNSVAATGTSGWSSDQSLGPEDARGFNELEARFRQALADEPILGSAGKQLRLRFHSCIPARFWVGRPLVTPVFFADGEQLEQGLGAWRRLALIRAELHMGRTNGSNVVSSKGPSQMEAIWKRLRAAFLEIWAETGHCPAKLEERLRSQEAAHQPTQRRCIDRWNQRLAQVERAEAKSAKLGRRPSMRGVQLRIVRLLRCWSKDAKKDAGKGLKRRAKGSLEGRSLKRHR